MKEKNPNTDMSRRSFLQKVGKGMGAAFAMSMMEPLQMFSKNLRPVSSQGADGVGENRMTYRQQQGSGEQISLLGFGMMRLPNNQEEVNQLVDYAIEHGVNYFDTAPMYMGGQSEVLTGNALSRHPRDKFFVATKMSNQNRRLWSFSESKRMYEQSFERLKVDHIDYYLLHSIGNGGMDTLNQRFFDNGLLEFLLKEREAGRIKHLGFSYHGDIRPFDYLLENNDKFHWDFVQIQMNFLDWRHASLNKGGWKVDADAEYLYNKCEKTGVQCVIMEPLRGGSFGRMASELTDRLQAVPPLEKCSEAENVLLAEIADSMMGYPTIPCTTCAYCMPCPYGVDIPGNFAYYNEAVNNHILPLPEKEAADYAARKQQFADGLAKALPKTDSWARSCTDCEECLAKCPQQIRIPNQMARIVELLRKR